MSGPVRLVLASANPDKAAEIAELLEGVELVPRPGDLADVVEDGDTLVANARLKADAVCRHTGIAAVADDTGLFVDALDGAPGVHTARFAGPDATPGRIRTGHTAVGSCLLASVALDASCAPLLPPACCPAIMMKMGAQTQGRGSIPQRIRSRHLVACAGRGAVWLSGGRGALQLRVHEALPALVWQHPGGDAGCWML